ncbi:ATP-binding protein [bacterium]|nr:ATP-binding protein [bacterium]
MKTTSIEVVNNWLSQPEDLKLEFKEAKIAFSKDRDLPDYCAAISNEGGGKLVLGVCNNRKIIGTKTFQNTCNRLSHELLNKLHIRVDVEEILHPDGRIIVFHIPGRPIGQIIRSTGKYKYPMRAGESLVEMDLSTIKRILNETQVDFSGEPVQSLTLEDLDSEAINRCKEKWAQTSQRQDFLNFSNEKVLEGLN